MYVVLRPVSELLGIVIVGAILYGWWTRTVQAAFGQRAACPCQTLQWYETGAGALFSPRLFQVSVSYVYE